MVHPGGRVGVFKRPLQEERVLKETLQESTLT